MKRLNEMPEHRKAPELMSAINMVVPLLDGWCPLDKALIMGTHIFQKKPELVVELGVFGGRSLVPMALAVSANGFGKVVGIDPWSKEAALEGKNDKSNDEWWATIDLEQIYEKFMGKVLEWKLTPWLFVQRMKSEEAVRNFRDCTIDVLHCDSNHSEKISLYEIDMWGPKVKVGGTWFMDDADWDTMQRAKSYIVERGFRLQKDHHKWAVYEKVR